MKLHYDEKAGALYLRLDDSEIVGIEVLDLKRRIPKVDLEQLRVEVASSTG